MHPRILVDNNEQDGKLLRRKAKKVTNVFSSEVLFTIQHMKRLAYEWESSHRQKCEGLAATQIGVPLRILIMRKTNEAAPFKPRVRDFDEADADQYYKALQMYEDWWRVHGATYDPWHVLLNPAVKLSEGQQVSEEGCLSLPGSTYTVNRPTRMFFTYTTPTNKRTGLLGVEGPNASVLAHELDHLDGVLVRDIAVSATVGEQRGPL